LGETVGTGPIEGNDALEMVPPNVHTVTRYNLKNPQVAFRSILLVTAQNVSSVDARLIAAFSNSLLDPYGVTNAEGFLSAIGSEIVTVQLAPDGDESIAISTIKDFEKLRPTVAPLIDFSNSPESSGNAKMWKSKDSDFAAAIIDKYLILGDTASVVKTIAFSNRRKVSQAESRDDSKKARFFEEMKRSDAVSSTFGVDTEIVGRLIQVFGETNGRNRSDLLPTLTETRFTREGIERRYLSEFGFIGTIVGQFE
jgi:hypothetical protein